MQELIRAIGLGPQAAAWFGLQLLLMILGALVAGGGSWRRLASLPLVMACLLLPLVAPLPPLARGLLAGMGMLAALKMLQLDFEPRWAAHHRLWHGLAPFDVGTARPAATAFDARLVALVLVHAALLVLAIFALLHLPAEPSPLRAPLRLLLGAAAVYTAMETATEALRLGLRLVRIDIPPIQRTPIASRSVGEFWSRRWNRTVSAWLNEYAFLPLARKRRPMLGLLAAFAGSAAFHAWAFYAAFGLRDALLVAAFFLLQAPVVMLETALGIARWPVLFARAWTLAWLLGSSPLFVLPLLRAFGL